jgi:hypothetical protein
MIADALGDQPAVFAHSPKSAPPHTAWARCVSHGHRPRHRPPDTAVRGTALHTTSTSGDCRGREGQPFLLIARGRLAGESQVFAIPGFVREPHHRLTGLLGRPGYLARGCGDQTSFQLPVNRSVPEEEQIAMARPGKARQFSGM